MSTFGNDTKLRILGLPNAYLSTHEDQIHCSKGALTDGFGWLIQIVLAFLAFLCLVLKRFCEPKLERRPWIIWLYDTSKQGLGAMVIHFANIYLASYFYGDPCTWYIVSFMLDSSIGLLIIYILIHSTSWFAEQFDFNVLIFGEYGFPPSVHAWIFQCGMYIVIVMTEKVFITLIINLQFWDQIRKLILSPITDPRLELALVVLVIPFIINTLMFWVTDNFLMRRKRKYPASKFLSGITGRARYQRTLDKKDELEDEVLLTISMDSPVEECNTIETNTVVSTSNNNNCLANEALIDVSTNEEDRCGRVQSKSNTQDKLL